MQYLHFRRSAHERSSTNIVRLVECCKASGTMRKHVSVAEVVKHNKAEDLWIVVNDHVYDMTEFTPTHPGGAEGNLIRPISG